MDNTTRGADDAPRMRQSAVSIPSCPARTGEHGGRGVWQVESKRGTRDKANRQHSPNVTNLVPDKINHQPSAQASTGRPYLRRVLIGIGVLRTAPQSREFQIGFECAISDETFQLSRNVFLKSANLIFPPPLHHVDDEECNNPKTIIDDY